STSSIDLKRCSLGFKASTISSNPPTTESIFKNESKEITPFCSNFLNVDNGTPDRYDRLSSVSSICNRLAVLVSTIFFFILVNDINNIRVVFNYFKTNNYYYSSTVVQIIQKLML